MAGLQVSQADQLRARELKHKINDIQNEIAELQFRMHKARQLCD